MKPITTIIAMAVLTAGAQAAGAEDARAEALQSWPVFEKGPELFVRLSYSGGLAGWDAAFGFDGERLTQVNSAFITVTDAKGKELPPRPDKLHSKFFNQLAKKPFDTRVNLAGVYDMSTPGRYIVKWGCEKVASQALRIEIAEEIPDKEDRHAEQADRGGAERPDDSDDTLRRYLSKSDLVVLGTIHSDPMALSGEAGVPNYICEFTVSDVCKGDAGLKGRTIQVNIKRFEMDRKDRHPRITKDAECILFLRKEGKGTNPKWVTADFWFGIQHHSPWMVRSLKRLAQRE